MSGKTDTMVHRAKSTTRLRVVSDNNSEDGLHRLISAAVDGDVVARERLAQACLRSVRTTVLLTYGNGNDYDDLCQIAMLKIFGGLPKFRKDGDFKVWVNRVTINVIKDYFRSRWLWFAKFDADIENRFPQILDPSPEDDLRRRRLWFHIAACFQKLKPKLRMVLVLSVLHGYASSEIAAMLDISFFATKKRLERAERLIIDYLRKDPACTETLEELGL
jgi:RNA polymerase sigma-70 factor, ECF subfamily